MITAFAHGLVQRSTLPIPEWLFGWAAAIVLCISFVALAALWPRPRLEHPGWRPLPGGRALGRRGVEVAGGVIGVAILALVLVTGYAGPPTPLDNFAPTFVFIIFWVGLVFASVLFGDLLRLFNPWRAIGRVVFRGREPRPYPPRLGRWPAVVGLFCFTWIELASGWGEHPATLATAVAGYSVVTLALMAVYGAEPWARHGEAFSVYFNLFSRMSAFETRNRVVGVRPFLGGLPRLDPVAGTVALVVVMIGTVTFDGLSQGRLWKDVAIQLNDGLSSLGVGLETTPKIVATLGLFIGVAIAGGFYTLGIEGARSVGGGHDGEDLRRGFIHTLAPIAMVYVAAHYLTFLLFEGQSILSLASDPLGEGWNLFGTASSAIDYGLLSQNAAWYLQVGFVVCGHVAALVLAHDRALTLYGDAKLAVRSQYWMLAIMVGFTSLALWLLAQAGK
ncbi:MAG: fenitrothion hydrolase [Solirubrobacteraceae bacterium]